MLLDAVLQADRDERLTRAVRRPAPKRERELDVLERAQRRHEPGLLADVADVVAAEASARCAVEPGDVRAEHEDIAVGRELEAGEELKKRRLPGAGRPGHGGERRRAEPCAEPVDCRPLRRTGAVDLSQRTRLGDNGRSAWRLDDRSGRFLHVVFLRRRRDDDAASLEPSGRMCANPRTPKQFFGQPQPAAASDDDRLLAAGSARRLLTDAAVADAHDAVGDRC